MDDVVVIKLKPGGVEAWRYTGRVLERSATRVVMEAFFNRDDLPFHGIVLGRGDRFVETYFTDRWYNIFEIHDRVNDMLKGWYCNITQPAIFKDGMIQYVDLALDLLVYPDGQQLVLDEDEFTALDITPELRRQSLIALAELQRHDFTRTKLPD